MWAKQKQAGFTIVELLIVIVVIGILAAITIVAYNGIQQRGRDAQRKSDIAQIAKAMKLYAVDNGHYVEAGSNCGSGGLGSGWYGYSYSSGTYKSISQCLIDGKYLSVDIVDPSGIRNCTGLSCHAYLKYSCPSGTYLFANLESMPQSSTDTDCTCSGTATYDTDYGMNYYIKVN